MGRLGACLIWLFAFQGITVSTAESKGLKALEWVTVNDTVMGGRSSARLDWAGGNSLVWSGRLSLENNGGFVSIRSQGTAFDWSEYAGVEVVIMGAGRDIQVVRWCQ